MRRLGLLALVACGKKDPVLQPDRLSLDVIVVDQVNRQLVRLDELHGDDWRVEMPLGLRDLARMDEDTVLASYDKGARLIDVHTGETVRDIAGYLGVTSAYPQPDGSVTLVFANTDQINTITVDRAGNETGSQHYVGYRNVRVLREGRDNHLLFTTGEPWAMVELDQRGNELLRMRLPGQGYMAMMRETHTFVVSTTSALQIVEFTQLGQSVATWSGAVEAERYGLTSFGGFDAVSEFGLMVVANGGPVDDEARADVVAFDAASEVVWSWSDPDVGSASHVAVLAVHLPE
ncbi:MAG TPA: hypothetical protein PKA64_13075 [Myxococcota bacterium]|nr:hypothetical protein [Myxococcota bacterium]